MLKKTKEKMNIQKKMYAKENSAKDKCTKEDACKRK